MQRNYLKTFSKGYFTISICLFILFFNISAHLLRVIYIKQLHYLNNAVDYTKSYAAALSGFRQINSIIDNNDSITQLTPPTLDDFKTVSNQTIEAISFKLIKTDSTIYIYSSSNSAQCILSASYTRPSENVILSNLSSYFGG